MSVGRQFPGIPIQDSPGGTRSIQGDATSIAAFVGWASRGPVGSATLVRGQAEFARQYGELDTRSELGYAVSQFFANGGTQAWIVRIVGAGSQTASARLGGTLAISARNPGAWGSRLAVQVTRRAQSANFQLQVFTLPPGLGPPVLVESFEKLSMKATDATYVCTAINAQSDFVAATVSGTDPTPPADTVTPVPLAGGADGAVLAPASTVSAVAGAFEAALLPGSGTGVEVLRNVDRFNLLCVPGEADPATLSALADFCLGHRAMLIADCAQDADVALLAGAASPASRIGTGEPAANAALYFPWISAPDPARSGQPRNCPPCGFVAGIYARTDASRGVWKAPAGTEANLTGALGASVALDDRDSGVLEAAAINGIRTFGERGTLVWGARTLQGKDALASQWKFVPVRRMALYLEESLSRGLQWVAFEPNDESLWAQIRLVVGDFMQGLFRQGAFQGQTSQQAWFGKCGLDTTSQTDIDQGIVNLMVGFAPLRPAEFVTFRIELRAGRVARGAGPAGGTPHPLPLDA